ncbi:uncharacterized protein TNCV_4916131 [Trichonephila clavipes]|nr:uncharacterized protein TNCV_4916131 [Trichonephila clavipes]
MIEQVLEETKTPESKHNGQLELERLKLERVKAELELAQLRTNASNSETSSNGGETETSIDVSIKSVRTHTIKVPKESEGWGFFFTSLERAYSNKNVPERFRAEILLNLLGEGASNILTYITEKELNNFEEIKSNVLREFEPTAQAELENFRNACRENETHVQFASRLTTHFEYYLKLRKVTDFDTLKELIVSDKMFQTLDRETAAHINIRQSEDWFRPLQLGKEWNSRDIALKRLESLWTRLSRAQEYQKFYRDFLKDYEELGHITEVGVEQNAHPTKRSVLSIITRLFDPLGLLGPVITRAKIFMQQF